MGYRRAPPHSLVLPREEHGRRRFLATGLAGAVLLALGGTWLATRTTRPLDRSEGPFRVFSAGEAAVLLAIADRLVPEHRGLPRPRELRLPVRMDAVAAMADPATQVELRRLVRLFESAAAGLLLDGDPEPFTAAAPERQDRRLDAWRESRIALRRTGYRALKRLVYATYYASPETWGAVGYPGPPFGVSRPAHQGAAAGRPPADAHR